MTGRHRPAIPEAPTRRAPLSVWRSRIEFMYPLNPGRWSWTCQICNGADTGHRTREHATRRALRHLQSTHPTAPAKAGQ